MTIIQSEFLNIKIHDKSPKERREWIRLALISAIRWYSNDPDKRPNDNEDIVVLSDLLKDLSD